MAILLGAFGPISKKIIEKIQITSKNDLLNKSSIKIIEENFFCIGSLDEKNDKIIPIDDTGIIMGRLFTKTDYSPVSSFNKQNDQTFTNDLMINYWGRYVAANWDKQANTLTIIRDPLGIGTLFYYQDPGQGCVFSSDIAHLYDVLEEKPTLYWKYFTDFLADSNHALPITPFEGIKEILPGVQYSINDQGIHEKILWNPPTQSQQFVYTSDKEIEDGLYKELKACILAWMHDAKGITVELSGGLDSSSLLVLYSTLAEGKIPVTALHHNDSAHVSSQELIYAKKIAEECNVPLKVLDFKEMRMLSDLPAGWRPSRPSGFLPYYGMNQQLLEYAHNSGCNEIVSGQGGDHVFLAPMPQESLADYWLERGLFGSLDILNQISAQYRAPGYAIVKNSIKAIWSYFQGKTLKIDEEYDKFKKNMLVNAESSPFYLNEILKRYYPAKAIHIKCLAHAAAYGDRDQRFENSVVTLPLLSQPLVEYALKIPTYRTALDGYNRYFFRKAISNLTDSKVIWRRGKGQVSSTYLKGLINEFDAIKSLLLNGKMLKQNIIKREWLDDQFQQIRHGKAEKLLPLLRTICCELWLKQWGFN